jgi:CRP-like cAMP-binding protein
VAASSETPATLLIRSLESVAPLMPDEKAALDALPWRVTQIKADQTIVREGDHPMRSCLIVSGFACAYNVTLRGKRQIMGFYIAGDLANLQGLHLPVMDTGLSTITACTVAFIEHETLRALCARHPGLAAAFWRETLVDAAIFREWVMNIGRREAYARLAHIFCEMTLRMRAVGLMEGDTCEFPINQSELADAAGLTTVHVNRTLMQMRADGLISLFGSQLTVPSFERLKEAGEFDPTYLHLHAQQAGAQIG